MAKLLELLDEDYRIANKISANENVHASSSCIENFQAKYRSFLSNFPEGSRLRIDAILEIKAAIQIQHNNGETLLTSSDEIDDTKFSELTNASCKELQKKYVNIDFNNLSSVSQQYQQQYVSESQKNENSLKENVDFSNPEETKKYFDDLYKGFSKCQTREEKLKYIEDGFGISLKNMSEQQQDEVISKCEVRGKIREIKENLRTEKKKEHPDLTDEAFEQSLEDMAVEQYSIENDKNFETEKNNNDIMIQLESYLCEREKLNQDLFNCHNENKKIEFEKKLNELEGKITQLIQTLSLTNDEIEKISKDSMEQDKNARLSETEKSTNELEDNQSNDDLSNLFMTDENELDNDLSDLFDPSITETEEDLSDLFTAENLPEIEENLNAEQPTNQDKSAFVNPILSNVKENDLKQEDYIIEIEEKEGLWNKLKNGFSKIKNAIVEKMGLNKVKLLNRQKYLNTAENNTKTTDIYSENKHSFDKSLIVSKEDQEKYRKEYEATKNTSQKDVTKIRTNTEQNINF